MTAGFEKMRHCGAVWLVRVLCLLTWAASWSQGAEAATAKAKASNRADNGAIAFHRLSGGFGYAVDQRTSRDARVVALKQCSDPDCEVVLTLKNSCGALANYRQTYFASRGATREEAESKARRQCGPKCEILVWACTK